jgi:tetratricopeptide (TPR) repeat protein
VKNKYVWLFTSVALLCLNGSAWAQVSEADSVKGELHVDSPRFVRTELTLSELHGGRSVAEVAVGADGRFEFRHVPYGEYRLTVFDGANQPIHEELISVHDQTQPIQVQVTLPVIERPASGTVSVRELVHPPTKKAFNAVVAAQKFAEAGAHDKAAEQLEKAIQLSPDYATAWINLAAQHIFLKRYEEGLHELEHAGEISKPTAMMLCDMAYAQYALHRYDEGVRSAREALRLDPSHAQAHYLLGSYLALDRRSWAEGIQHLEVAARSMPAARTELEHARHESAQVVTHP